jgi:hypothetical protein
MKLVANLENAQNAVDRNAAALDMVEVYAEAQDRLLSMLKDPTLDGEKGTLLYAMDKMNIPVPVEVLVDLLTGDGYSPPSYEIQQEALTLICQITENDTTPEEVGRAQRHLYYWPVQDQTIMTAQLALRELNF